MRIADLLVVGAGPAGVAAAAQAARLGLEVRIIDRAGRAGGLVANGFLVENYPGLEAPVPGAELARRLGEHLARYGLAVDACATTSEERHLGSLLAMADAVAIPTCAQEVIGRCG